MLYDGESLRLTGMGLVTKQGSILDPRFVNHDLDFWTPEMIERKPLTNKSDLYSAGVFLYFMLVGEFPFVEGSEEN